jgi:four helix bundle protein
MRRMAGVTRFQDLEAWKLATELSDVVYRITDTGPVAAQATFKQQIRESSASAASNIAEGFGRYYPRENASFVRCAKGSITETENHLLLGKRRSWITEAAFGEAWELAERALKATTRYLKYLESCEGRVPGSPATTTRKR